MPTTVRATTIAAAVVGVYILAVRPRMLRWGATAEELERSFPGADLIPDGVRSATMAVTLDTPPALMSVAFLEPSHWVMQTRQFANLRRRVERAEQRSAA